MNGMQSGVRRLAIWVLLFSSIILWGMNEAIVSAVTFNSTNYSINGSIGDSVSGAQASTSYKLVSSGGQSIIGNGTSGSYMLGEGYTAQLERSLQVQTQPANLAAYYPLDEGSGTQTYDASATGQSGNLQASPTWTTGKIGNALSFNGTSQYVSLPDVDVAGSAITVSAWVYPTSASQSAKILGKQTSTTDAQGTLSLSSGKASFEVTTGGTYRNPIGTTTLPTNTWSRITGVYDGSNAYIYVNGSQEASVGATGALSNNNVGWAVAALNASSPANYFAGRVDEAKIFSRALSASEVSAEYQATNSGVPAGLALGTITPGTSNQINFDNFVKTDASAYTLSINQDHDLQSGATTISPVSGSIASPVSWSEGSTKGLGFSLYGTNATAIPGKWSSGTSFAALPGSATTFYTRSGVPTGTDYLNMRLRLDTTLSQLAASYSNQMTITGTITP